MPKPRQHPAHEREVAHHDGERDAHAQDVSTYASSAPRRVPARRHGLEDGGEEVALGEGALELDRVVDHDLGDGHDLIALGQLGELVRLDALRA